MFSIETTLVATKLAFGNPVVILGPVGSGKQIIGVQALKMCGEDFPLTFDFLRWHQHREDEYINPFDSARRWKWSDRHDKITSEYPDRPILYTSVEYMSPEWVCKVLEMMMFSGRKVVMTGTHLMYPPVFNRCEIVSL